MKIFFIVNPMSANGATGKRWAQHLAVIARTVKDYEVAFTRAPLEATSLANAAVKSGALRVVAVGGDGTVNEVLNGLFEGGAPINKEVALGLIPAGTGGDFRRTFGWSTDIDEAIVRLADAKTSPLDVGRIDFIAHDGRQATRYFANVCSFGASGLVDREVNRTSKVLGGKVSFFVGSLKALTRYRDQPVRVSVDGGPWEKLSVTTLAAANGQYFGGGMKVAPDASVRDGLLDITIWSGYGLADFVLKSPGVYSGAHVHWKGTRTLKAKTLVAESDEEVLIDCDGEQPGRLPCTISVLPGAIRWIGEQV